MTHEREVLLILYRTRKNALSQIERRFCPMPPEIQKVHEQEKAAVAELERKLKGVEAANCSMRGYA